MKRAFWNEFKDDPNINQNWLQNIQPNAFQRVYDRFKKNGSVHKQDNGGRKVTVMTEENIELVQLSLRKGALWTGHYLK